MPNWSHSRLALFENCRRAYLHKYVREDPRAQDSPLRRDGQTAHRDIEVYSRRCFAAGKKADLTIAKQVASRHLGTRDDLASLFTNWAERHAGSGGFDWQHVMADGQSVERWVDCELPNGDRFRGRLDLVLFRADDRTLVVRDYKSGRKTPPPWDPDEPPFQHLVYAYLAFKTWPPAEKCIAQVEYVRFAYEPIHEWDLFPPLPNVEQSIMEQIGVIGEWLAELETRDNRRQWHEDLSPGDHCQYCDWGKVCPGAKRWNYAITSPEDAVKKWNTASAFAARATALRADVGAWIDAHAGALYTAEGDLLARHYPTHALPGGFVPHPRPGMFIPLLQRGQKFGLDPLKLRTPAGIARALQDYPEACLDEKNEDGSYKFLVLKRARAELSIRTADVPNIAEPPEKDGPKALEEDQ